MGDASGNSVKNVLAESTALTKEGNNACSEKSKHNTLVESCDKKKLSVDSSSGVKKKVVANAKQKIPEQATPKSENKKVNNQKNKEKDVPSNKGRINEKDKKLSASTQSKGDKRPEKKTKSSQRLRKSPIQRSISPRYDRHLRRPPIRYGGYSSSPTRRTLSPRRYDRSPEHDILPRRKSRSPIPYNTFQYNKPEYSYTSRYIPGKYAPSNISPTRHVLSPQRYDRSPEQYCTSPKRKSWSPISDVTLKDDKSPRRQSRSPISDISLRDYKSPRRCSRSPIDFYDKTRDRNIHDKQRNFSSKTTKNKKQAKIMSVMQTGLVPPGMEAEFDLSSLSQSNRSVGRNIDRDLAPKIEKRILERRSFSPSHSKTVRSEEILEAPKNYREILNPYGEGTGSPKIREYACFLDEIEDIFVEKKKTFMEDNKLVKMNKNPSSGENKFVDKKKPPFLSKNRVVEKKKSVPKSKFTGKNRKLSSSEGKSMEKRKSFLEEIEEKLQLKQSNVNTAINKSSAPLELQNSRNKQLHFPGTAPVSQVNLNGMVQPGTSHQLYHNQPQMIPHNLPQSIGQHGFIQQDALHMPQSMSHAMQHVPQLVPTPFLPRPINPLMNAPPPLHIRTQNWNQHETDVYAKLLADKKTTLSDCVRLGPPSTDKSMNIQNKINAITRCQEAIKVLNKNIKTDGQFFVKTLPKKSEKPAEMNGLCPFRRLRVTRFQFTSKSCGEDKPSMPVVLDRFLIKLRQKHNASTKELAYNSPEKLTVERLPNASCSEEQLIPTIETQSIRMQNTTASISTQTEDISCKECETRHNILKSTIYTQTNEAPLTFDISCQISPEEFAIPIKGILKKQALKILSSEELMSNQKTSELGESSSANSYNPNMRNMSDLDHHGLKRQRLSEHGFEDSGDGQHEDRNKRSYDYNHVDVNPYGDSNTNRYARESDLRDKIISLSNTRIFSRERPTFSKPFPSKTIPFGSFDYKLNLDFPKPFTSPKKELSKDSPYNSAPPTDKYWNRRY